MTDRKDIVMVIENHRGQEVNSLLTFDDFIEKHMIPYADSYREVAEMTAAMFKAQRDKTKSWQDWYHAANESFYARLCGSEQELNYFLCGTFNDDRSFKFDAKRSSEGCLEALKVRGMTTDGKYTAGQYHYEELAVVPKTGAVLHNFNGNDYKLLEKFTDHNLLLMDVASGQFLVGVDTRSYCRTPKYAESDAAGDIGIEWGHGIYLSNVPSAIDFARLKREYEKPYQMKGKEFEIEIREILSRVENIKADTLGGAIDKAMEMYEHSEVVLDADDHKGVDYIPVKRNER